MYYVTPKKRGNPPRCLLHPTATIEWHITRRRRWPSAYWCCPGCRVDRQRHEAAAPPIRMLRTRPLRVDPTVTMCVVDRLLPLAIHAAIALCDLDVIDHAVAMIGIDDPLVTAAWEEARDAVDAAIQFATDGPDRIWSYEGAILKDSVVAAADRARADHRPGPATWAVYHDELRQADAARTVAPWRHLPWTLARLKQVYLAYATDVAVAQRNRARCRIADAELRALATKPVLVLPPARGSYRHNFYDD